MKLINYKKDEQLLYKKEILDGLIAYNIGIVGQRYSDDVNIYVHRGNELVGGCQVELGWNWIYIMDLFYTSKDIFRTIINTLVSRYHNKAEGIMIFTYMNEQIKDFKGSDFIVLGKFENMPIGYSMHVMTNTHMEIMETENTYDILMSKEKHERYHTLLQQQVDGYKKANGIDESKEELIYSAFDGEKLVGGVYGYLKQSYLYISYLWVDKDYRECDIGTKLMDLIEDEARRKGFDNAYLGTCTFQARPFYEKRGYKVTMIVNNCPKGYDDFTMVKKI